MPEFLIVLLVVLATHRLTRLVLVDRITEVPRVYVQEWAERRWFKRHPGERETEEWRSLLAYWFSCVWCASIWVGAGVVLTTMWTVGLPVPALVWLASSSVTGLLSSYEKRGDER